MGEQFTSAKTQRLSDGPSVYQVVTDRRKAENDCRHWGFDALIKKCADRLQEEQLRSRP